MSWSAGQNEELDPEHRSLFLHRAELAQGHLARFGLSSGIAVTGVDSSWDLVKPVDPFSE